MLGKILGFIILGVLVFLAYKQIVAIVKIIKDKKQAKNSPLADKQEDNNKKGEKVGNDRN